MSSRLNARCPDCGIFKSEVAKHPEGLHHSECQSECEVNVRWGLAHYDRDEYRFGKRPKKERKTGKRFGNTEGLTKETNPRLANRLPREKGGLVVGAGDGFTPFERALIILGPRVRETKDAYLLDGKPCNATRIMEVAGIVV